MAADLTPHPHIEIDSPDAPVEKTFITSNRAAMVFYSSCDLPSFSWATSLETPEETIP
jgi:hypothetical protein